MDGRIARWSAGPAGLAMVAAPGAGAMSPAHGPVGNPGSWFGPDAYPAAALRRNEQGRTVATLAIDANGRVSSCVVTVSSGSRALDGATCAIARERGHYAPAVDAQGTPIAANQMLPVRWVLPDDGPASAEPAAAPPPAHRTHSWWSRLGEAEHLLVALSFGMAAAARKFRRTLGWGRFDSFGGELQGDRMPVRRARWRQAWWWRLGVVALPMVALAALLAWLDL